MKLIAALKTLDKKELSRFELFLQSPYHNSNQKLCTLFKSLKKEYPSFQFSKESVFGKVFPKKDYDDVVFRRHSNMLYQLLKEFVVLEVNKSQRFFSDLSLLKFFRERNLNKEFATYYKKYWEQLEKNKTSTSSTLQKYLLEYERYLFEEHKDPAVLDIFHQKLSRDIKHREELKEAHKVQPYWRVTNQLDSFSTFQKLYYYCLILNWRNERKVDNPVEIRLDIRDTLSSPLKENTTYQTWFSAANLLEKPNQENYQRLYDFIQKYAHEMEAYDVRTLCAYLQNNLKRVEISGSIDYFNKLFDLYSLQDEIGVFNHRLDSFIFRNIVTVSLTKSKLSWLSKFIEKHQLKLSSFKDGSLIFAKARLSLAIELEKTEKSQKALKDIFFLFSNDVEFQLKNMFDKLLNRQLQIQICYELGDDLLFDTLYNSFSTFISRNEEYLTELDPNQIHIQGNRNFLRIIKKIFRLKHDDIYTQNQLRTKLLSTENEAQNETFVASRFYLLNKIDELKDKK